MTAGDARHDPGTGRPQRTRAYCPARSASVGIEGVPVRSTATSGPIYGDAGGRAADAAVEAGRQPASRRRPRQMPRSPPCRCHRARRARRWRCAWRWRSATRSPASWPVQSVTNITVSSPWFSRHGHVPDGRERTAPEHHAKVEHQVEESGAGAGRGGMPMKGPWSGRPGCTYGRLPEGALAGWTAGDGMAESPTSSAPRLHPVSGTSCWPPSSASRDHARTGLPGHACASGSRRGLAKR
jgi:hypothetical protein